MSSNGNSTFTIEYYGLDGLKATEQVTGRQRKAESQALIGMIRHLYSGVDRARILDVSGREINALLLPGQQLEAI
jgi:hypothetical protein